ncbi:hypothetical protein HK103_002630 [Boothiomyces macroporosus]|uniref:Uncharacterized protein n=1 Tax=Boothiomyces macroporosus TaxID=261099 RepID=A0AAD5UMQ5_9FUNG|nr:hypothetical protein HK103_002630 [Boothiomyces macroporosus]
MWVGQHSEGEVSAVAIHPVLPIIAASSSKDGSVAIYDDDLVSSQALQGKKDLSVTNLKWHPTRKFLAITWKNGIVGLWCLEGEPSFREGIVHDTTITCLEWSPGGNRLITGDEEGGVVVWKIDGRGKLSTMSQYRLRGSIDHIVFKPTKKARDSRNKEKDCPPFFIGVEQGIIFFADDIGHCMECVSLNSRINLLYYHDGRDLLLVLNDEMILSHFVQDNDGKLTLETSQIKLGGAMNTNGKELASQWIDTDLLAFIVNKLPPRIWDSANEETIVLDRPGNSENTLLVRKSNGMQVLAEHVLLSAAFGTDVQVCQTGTQSLALESCKNAPRKIEHLQVTGKIRGISLFKESLAVWTGKVVEAYSIDGVKPQAIGTVECGSSYFGINNQFVFTANQNVLTIMNLQSSFKSDIVLPAADGDIFGLCCTADNVILCTTTHLLKIFEVNQKDNKLLSTHSLEEHFSENTQSLIMKPNVDGTLIAFAAICWDTKDPRYVQCQIHVQSATISTLKITPKDSKPINQIISFFVTSKELIFKDIQPIQNSTDTLVAVSLPYQQKDFKAELENFTKQLVKEYAGINTEDEVIVRTITEFCFHLAVGDLDEAVKVVKLIRNNAVWENMASVCIKTRRTNLAQLCLRKLKNAKALRTVSNLKRANDYNSISAYYAIHLGMYDDAKDIWAETKNYYDLNLFYQATGKWEQALEIAASKDRQSLPSTYYNFAKYLEETNDFTGAIAAYEKSNASKADIPRMMLKHHEDIPAYIDSTNEPEIKRWWAQNAESHGDFATALKYYEVIGDVFAIVRVHCLSGNIKQAMQISDLNPKNHAAAYYIAREFEQENKFDDAIVYYSRAKCFSNAIRIAKENKIEKQLMQLALQSTPVHMNDVAKYYEGIGNLDNAITLYSKSGNIKKAIDLCFKTKNVFLLESIASSLDPEKDGDLLQATSAFLSENNSNEVALKLLLVGHKYKEVLDICETQNVQLTEDFLSRVDTSGIPDGESKEINLRIANICFTQANYQGGDRLKAMGSLLKSGDKDRIITFATVSKHPEIFVIAANYLQSLNWINDTSIMRVIIQFYTKAKAYLTLSRFYESCAQIEIDEYQNYEKALSALNEAEKALAKDKSNPPLNVLKHKQALVSMFLDAHKAAAAHNIDECEQICAQLLNQEDIDVVIRIGDIFGLLIETSYSHGDLKKAAELLHRLRMRLSSNMNVEYYVDPLIVKALVKEEQHENESIEENF